MQPVRVGSPQTLSSEALDDWGPAKVPVGKMVAHTRGTEVRSGGRGNDRVGVWECSPGRWRRQVMEREFAHFISGQGRFVPDVGEPFEIRAGDAVWFPAHTTGTWEITETLRKTYVIVSFTPLEALRHTVLRRVETIWRSIQSLLQPASRDP
jgi:uncharacterized cupin superfamily protein